MWLITVKMFSAATLAAIAIISIFTAKYIYLIRSLVAATATPARTEGVSGVRDKEPSV